MIDQTALTFGRLCVDGLGNDGFDRVRVGFDRRGQRITAKSTEAYLAHLDLLAVSRLQPLIVRRTKPAERTRWTQLTFWVFLSGIYGGYFSAAQGVILLGVLGLFLASDLQEQNAVKNVLQALVNIVAALFFIVTGAVAWRYAAMVAIGSLIGAPVGAALAKKIPTGPFRVGIVVFGVLMAGVMAWMAKH